MVLLTILILLMVPFTSLAQEESLLAQLQVPEPITELFNTFENIDIDTSRIPILNRAFQGFGQAVQNPEGAANDLTGLFERINAWFQSNVGVSLGEITKAIGNFIVWVLELIVKLIKAGLSLIT